MTGMVFIGELVALCSKPGRSVLFDTTLFSLVSEAVFAARAKGAAMPFCFETGSS